MIDAKPAKRHVATKAEWKELHAAHLAACCVSCGLRYQHLHHACFRKADRGDDVIENLVPMCNSCHERFHMRAPGWERIAGHIRAYVWARASRLNYVLDKIGLERFDRRYPHPPHLAIGDLDRYRTPDSRLRESEAVEGYERP